MKAFIIALALVGMLVADNATKWGVSEDEDVAVLTKDNFASFVKDHKYVFVKFYAPWCGHCKTMAPAYSKLAKRTKGEDNGVPIAKVDATVEAELAERYGVKGFPSLKLFIDGEPVDYSGAREEDAIYSWIQKKSGPATKELTSLDDVKALEGQKLAVLLVTSADNTSQLNKLNTVANGFEDISFHYTTSQEVKDYLGVGDKQNTFIVFRNFDDGKQQLADSEELSADALKDFLNTHRFPLVMPFEQEAAERIFGSETPAIFIFNEGTESAATKAFAAVAKRRGKDILFSQSTITTGLGARLSEFLGVTAADADGVRIIRFAGGNLTKFKLNDVTEAGIDKFIDDWKADKLSAYYKSEPVPDNSAPGVKVIVGDNFEDLVLNSDKHVLLEAYAPWCGHCKKLEPIYDELAKRLANEPDIIIAKMDATANEHSAVNVKGFPTIKFYKKGSKDAPSDYAGDRTLEGFLAYLEKEVGRDLGQGSAGDEQDVKTKVDVDEL